MYGATDQVGNQMAPCGEMATPEAASGQTLDQTSDTEITVESGQVYTLTACVGYCLLGLLTTATAANIIWACAAGQTIQIKVPANTTTLHYICVGTTPKAFLRKNMEMKDQMAYS